MGESFETDLGCQVPTSIVVTFGWSQCCWFGWCFTWLCPLFFYGVLLG